MFAALTICALSGVLKMSSVRMASITLSNRDECIGVILRTGVNHTGNDMIQEISCRPAIVIECTIGDFSVGATYCVVTDKFLNCG